MNNIFVSVVIPIYNVEEYLIECLDSIITQTYSNLEIILVNDGSTDTSPIICDNYARKDSRIKVIHKKNGGLSDARNFGIEQVTGDYICFIDSDDYVEKNYVEELLASALEHESDLVICDFIEFGDERLIDPDSSSFYSKNLYNNIELLVKILDKVPSHHSAVNVVAWNKLIKMDKLSNLRFQVGMKHEDMFFIHHLIYNTPKISIVDKKLYNYRQRSSGISNTNSDVNKYHNYLAICDREMFFKDKFPGNKKIEFYQIKKHRKLINLFYTTNIKEVKKDLLLNYIQIIRGDLLTFRQKLRLTKDLIYFKIK